MNGQLTLGENIGDLGGLEMAYAAYRRHVAQHGEPPVIDGLTGDQRFFLSFAQAWRSNIREGALRERLLTLLINRRAPVPQGSSIAIKTTRSRSTQSKSAASTSSSPS